MRHENIDNQKNYCGKCNDKRKNIDKKLYDVQNNFYDITERKTASVD